ncbi:Uncharacterized protein BM_BM17387 [Brugia malayi]|uniref:Uncharacterized protein n=1 Tax=Brugia malayi TaxID=6279 RepID=A0A4E9F407_BRUMA|nr:Uncharacterized protein BM_BM17387 [Brugia malayi]VIO91532.1 Uncharacterized protein BM_BM17387 [Brugia malayi]
MFRFLYECRGFLSSPIFKRYFLLFSISEQQCFQSDLIPFHLFLQVVERIYWIGRADSIVVPVFD